MEQITAFGWQPKGQVLESCNGGNLSSRDTSSSFSICRSVKSSLQKLLLLPSWESLVKYWRDKIIPDFSIIWRDDPRELCGVLMDPVLFLPLYLARFLERRELEGDLPVPGSYVIELKVKQACGNFV